MAGPDRMSPDDLKFLQNLEEAPYGVDFYAALRAFECMYSSHPRFGHSMQPHEDPVRLGQFVSLSFPTASIEQFKPRSDGLPSVLRVNLFGLLGPNGPMPLHISEYIYERLMHFNDETLAAFLDLFHHRLLSLFYRAWADSEPAVSMDRPETDHFGVQIASLIGLGMKSLRKRDDMPDWSKLHFSGALSCQTRHPEGLKAILSEFFGVRIEIEELVGRWIPLPKQCLCQLGSADGSAQVGATATIGYRVWDYQQSFRIIVGPVSYDLYQRMLPGREGLKRLTAIVRNYCGDEFAWQVQLILKREEIPQVRLGHHGSLGWSAWMMLELPLDDAQDLIMTPAAA